MTARLPAQLALPAVVLAALPLALSACAPADPAAEAARAASELAAAPAAKVLGPGEACINRDQVRATVVRSASVIDFELNSGKVYRNTLRQRCPGLDLDRGITYQTSISQLCRQQIVYALQNFGGVPQRGAGCALGDFVPVEYVKAKK